MTTIINDILRRHNQDGGSTTRLTTGENLAGQDLYAVSPFIECEYTSSLPLDAHTISGYILANEDRLLKGVGTFALGTWQEAGLHYIDVVACVDRETAEIIGRRAEQIAICYLKDCSVIKL